MVKLLLNHSVIVLWGIFQTKASLFTELNPQSCQGFKSRCHSLSQISPAEQSPLKNSGCISVHYKYNQSSSENRQVVVIFDKHPLHSLQTIFA